MESGYMAQESRSNISVAIATAKNGTLLEHLQFIFCDFIFLDFTA